jgi:hypothetical protein
MYLQLSSFLCWTLVSNVDTTILKDRGRITCIVIEILLWRVSTGQTKIFKRRTYNLSSVCLLLAGFLHGFQRWKRWHIPPKRLLTFNGIHDIIFQKMQLLITTAMRISNLTLISYLILYKRLSYSVRLAQQQNRNHKLSAGLMHTVSSRIDSYYVHLLNICQISLMHTMSYPCNRPWRSM